jgi:hypothetical protein
MDLLISLLDHLGTLHPLSRFLWCCLISMFVGIIVRLLTVDWRRNADELIWLVAAICMGLFTWYFDRAWLLTILPG